MRLRCLSGLLLAAASMLQAAELPSAESITRLPAQARAQFEAQVLGKSLTPQVRIRRLVEFMFDAEGLGLEYDNERSRTVAESIAERKANCLSFTLTFIELAKLANFRARMVESEQSLIWFMQDNTLFLAGHVSSYVSVARHRFEVNFDPNAPITQGQRKTVSSQRAIAHYYNNRAAELMAQNDMEAANAYFEAALAQDPQMVSALNNHGVLLRRLGNLNAAEASFKRALSIDRQDLSALTNLIGLYKGQQRSAEVAGLEEKLASAQRKNPLHHFIVGMHVEQQGDNQQALVHFRTAARLDRKEPIFQLALARVNEALGNTAEAERNRRRAERLRNQGPRGLSSVARRTR